MIDVKYLVVFCAFPKKYIFMKPLRIITRILC